MEHVPAPGAAGDVDAGHRIASVFQPASDPVPPDGPTNFWVARGEYPMPHAVVTHAFCHDT